MEKVSVMGKGGNKTNFLSLSLPATSLSANEFIDPWKSMNPKFRRQIDRMNCSDAFGNSFSGSEDQLGKVSNDGISTVEVDQLTKAVDSFSFSSRGPINKLNASGGNLLSTSLNASSQLFSLLGMGKDQQVFSECLKHANKATFTTSTQSSVILVANDIASKLFGYEQDELIGKKLSSFLKFPDSFKLFDFENELLDPDGNKVIVSGKIAEGVNKEKERFPVSIWMKHLADENQKCIVVIERIQRITASFEYDSEHVIKSCDTELAMLTGCGSVSELIGQSVIQLIPHFDKIAANELLLEHKEVPCTCLTQNNRSIPVMLSIDDNGSTNNNNTTQTNLPCSATIHFYSNLSGLLAVERTGKILSCNVTFLTMLFGYAESDIIRKNISQLVPYLQDDIKQQTSCAFTNSINSYLTANDDKPLDSARDDIMTSSAEFAGSSEDGSTTAGSSTSVSQSSQTKDSARSSGDSGILVINDKVQSPGNRVIYPAEDLSTPSEVIGDIALRGPVLASTPNRPDNSAPSSRQEYLSLSSDSVALSDGIFTSMARHKDGGWFPVMLEVKRAMFNGNRELYCLWVTRLPDPKEGRRRTTHQSSTSALHSTPADKIKMQSSGATDPCNAFEQQLIEGSFSKDYEALETIGAGAFGVVKTARQKCDGLQVVVKFISKCDLSKNSLIDHPELGVIPKEIAVVSQLRHPNIIQMIDLHENDHYYHMIMVEHGECMDLFAFVEKRPLLDEALTSYIFRQAIAGVAYLHSRNFLHRDIKDENMIINHAFHLKLIDFGSVVHMDEAPLYKGFCGTMEYCSPEVLLGLAYQGAEAEVWALGVTLYILAFGYNPFFDVEDIPKAKVDIPGPISEDLLVLLKRMLQKSPKKRPTIEEIETHPWLTMPVEINDYSWEAIIPMAVGSESNDSVASDNEGDLDASAIYEEGGVLEEDYERYLNSLHFYNVDDSLSKSRDVEECGETSGQHVKALFL